MAEGGDEVQLVVFRVAGRGVPLTLLRGEGGRR